MSARAFLGAGDLYLEKYDPLTQVFLPREGPFETEKFEIKPNSELKQATSRGKTTYAQTIEAVPVPKPTDFSVTLTEITKQTIEMALFATGTDLNVASGTMTDEAIVAKLEKWAVLPHANFAAAGFVVKNAAGSTTYVLGVDYLVNYALGMVKPLTAGAIAADQALKVSGTYNAITGRRIAGGTQTQVRARFILDGVNFVDNSPCIVTVHEAVLTPESAFDFMAAEFGKIPLKGQMKTPVGFDAPFHVDLRG